MASVTGHLRFNSAHFKKLGVTLIAVLIESLDYKVFIRLIPIVCFR